MTGHLIDPTNAVKEAANAAHVVEQKGGIAKAAAKPRIDCIDGVRFALVLPIIIGHFVRFATNKEWLLKLLTQENVLVGGFFIISGYVSGYTSTNVGERSHDSKKLAVPELFFWQKVMSYYPLHVLVSTFFAPMFLWAERMIQTPWRTSGFHAFLNYTLLQAWFPSEAEIWNPPTWFLSALTFSNALMPTFVLPQVSKLSQAGNHKLICWLSVISLLQKLSYSQAWQFYCRGAVLCRTSQPQLWNSTRFHPVWAAVEVTMGVAAARSVMLDEEPGKPAANPLWYYLASHATLALRVTRLNLNDALIRSLLFVPLYIKFLTTLHRDAVSPSPSAITRFFGSSWMSYLGSLAFPMFVLHGPVGQLFYKKLVALKLFGTVMPMSFFPKYMALVMVAAALLNEFFVKSARVKKWSADLAQLLARHTRGMLKDHDVA